MEDIVTYSDEDGVNNLNNQEDISNENREYSNNTPKIPGISNILENTLYPSEIISTIDTTSASIKEIATNIGTLPFIWYNAYQIGISDLIYFQMNSDDILPTISISFKDSHGIIGDIGVPRDDSKIKVFLNSMNPNIKSIFLEFKIVTFKKIGDGYFTIGGILNVNEMFIREFKSYKDYSSKDVIYEFCKKSGLGLNCNVDNMNDNMNWINIGEQNFKFIENVLLHSYISDNSFVYGYVDYYYNFNLVDIETELSKDIKNSDAFIKSAFEGGITGNKDSYDIKEETTIPYLSNEATLRNSNFHILNYSLLNNSTDISLKRGYKTNVKYYDIETKELLNFENDSIVNVDETKIVMRTKDEDFLKKNTEYKYLGKQDSDNVHPNYKYSKVINDRNLEDLNKLGMVVELSNSNYNLYKFQKILVFIMNNETSTSHTLFNERLSGEWFITNIQFVYSENRLMQRITLIKRELELTNIEKENFIFNSNLDKEVGRGTHENPSDDGVEGENNNKPTSNKNNKNNTKMKTSITLDELVQISGTNKTRMEPFLDSLNQTLSKFEINNKLRIAHFLGQVLWESGNFFYMTELASGQAYEGRKDLGNVEVGDGVRFKGRGAIQITGRNMYSKVSKYFGVDFVTNPSTLADLPYSIQSAGWYWKHGSVRGDLNKHADKDDLVMVTKGVNGGTNHISERKKIYLRAMSIL